jgi:hypothetical protein
LNLTARDLLTIPESRMAPGGFSENQDSISLIYRHPSSRLRHDLLGQRVRSKHFYTDRSTDSADATGADNPPATQQAPSAQTPSSQTPDQSQAPSSKDNSAAGASSAAGAASDSQTFSGTVVKAGDKYTLKDDSGKTYDIDHQTDVAKFEGKRVRVQGKLDDTGTKIMVK